MATPVQAGSAHLVRGRRYRGRMLLDGAAAWLGTREQIAAKFEDLGFTDVQIWMSQDELPSDWPEDQRDSRSGARFGEGAWGRADVTFTLPDEVLTVWDAPASSPSSPPPPPSTPPPSISKPANATQRAAVVLAAVWPRVSGGRVLTRAVRQVVLGVARLESMYGTGWNAARLKPESVSALAAQGWVVDAAAAARSHNWGAVQCPTDCSDANAFRWIDHHADGTPYGHWFRAYPSDEDGCADYVRILLRCEGFYDAANSGSTDAAAAAMRDCHYFEATTYAAALAKSVASVAADLGEPVVVGGGSESVWPVVVGCLLTVGVIGAAGWWAYQLGADHV